MMNARKERHGAIEITDPNLGGAGIEVQGAFFVDLSLGVGSGKDLHANRRGSGKRGRWIKNKPTFLSEGEQDNIGDSHLAVASKDSLLDRAEFAGIQVVEEIGNSASSLAMVEARRWRHDEFAGGVDLETFGTIGEGGIAADLEPPSGGRTVGHDRRIRRYAGNGKRHKKQNASKKAATVCAWVPGRGGGGVGRVRDRVAGQRNRFANCPS
jgi:hypothetical protein